MKDILLPIIIGILGISGLLYGVIENAEVKGYTDVHSCWGECYEEYVRVHGTAVEQLKRQQAEAAEDPF